MQSVGGIFIVIYVDVLFIINFFMTFFLLQITAKLCKNPSPMPRMIIASVIGGLYSMIILLDKLPEIVVLLSKFIAAGIIVLVAFRFSRARLYFISVGIFLFSSFVVLGVVVGIYMLFDIDSIAVNNSAIYFDVSAAGIILAGLVAYILSSIAMRLYNRVLTKRELYTLVIENKGRSVTMLAMLDTGNRLREPFSNTPVIVVKGDLVSDIVGDSKIRYIPASSIGSRTLLTSFKPDRILLKSSKNTEVITNAYVALSYNLNSDGFSAVLNPEILSV